MLRTIMLAGMLLFVAGAAAPARAQSSVAEEKRRDIRRLIELNGSAAAGGQVFEEMLPNMRAVFAAIFDSLPPAKRALAVRIMEEETRRVFTAERMAEGMIPIYEKYLTADDVKALITFYESPAGRKFVGVQPLLIRESAQLGESMGHEAVEGIYRRYRQEGIRAAPPPRQTPRPRRRP